MQIRRSSAIHACQGSRDRVEEVFPRPHCVFVSCMLGCCDCHLCGEIGEYQFAQDEQANLLERIVDDGP